MKSLDDLKVAGKRVLVRADLNVPMNKGVIADDRRISASVDTISTLRKRGASVIVAAHLGRPKGEVKHELSLRPVGERLSELLGADVAFAEDVAGPGSRGMAMTLTPGSVGLIENVRFDARETSAVASERQELARQYASLADVFVSDGFGVVHRKQASVYDVAELLPHAAGHLVQREMDVLHRLTTDIARPYVVILGGSKVSDKIGVIENLLDRVDRLIIGGGMVYTFLAAQGHSVGKSLLEEDRIDLVQSLLKRATDQGIDIVLPTDIVVADAFAADASSQIVSADSIPDGALGLDIGPTSQHLFSTKIADAHTVFWNGPMGVFEFPAFASGTRVVAEALTGVDGLTVVGGGDSAAAIRQLGFDDSQFGHISTGGGASLEYLEGKQLPGIAALEG